MAITVPCISKWKLRPWLPVLLRALSPSPVGRFDSIIGAFYDSPLIRRPCGCVCTCSSEFARSHYLSGPCRQELAAAAGRAPHSSGPSVGACPRPLAPVPQPELGPHWGATGTTLVLKPRPRAKLDRALCGLPALIEVSWQVMIKQVKS